MYVSRLIDWLEFTLPSDCIPQDKFPVWNWRRDGAGLHGYAHRYVDTRTGVQVEFSDFDSPLGCHYRFGGSTLGEVERSYGLGIQELLRHIDHWKGKASRIDLAIDCHEGELTPMDYYNAIKQGEIKARGRSFKIIEGTKRGRQGQTVYIGSEKSDKMVRVYDKAAEQRTVDEKAWVRLEIQCRRLVARNAYHSCIQNGVDQTVCGHISKAINWLNAEFSQAVKGDSVAPYDIGRKLTNRQNWLLTQVAQALRKELDANPDFWDLFSQAVGFPGSQDS